MKYFNIPYLIAYYQYIDFNLGVDQLAKNMLLRTWDGVIWYTTIMTGTASWDRITRHSSPVNMTTTARRSVTGHT